VTLLGLPSYEYLLKGEEFQRYEEMIEFQKNLISGTTKNKDNSTSFTYKKKADESG